VRRALTTAATATALACLVAACVPRGGAAPGPAAAAPGAAGPAAAPAAPAPGGRAPLEGSYRCSLAVGDQRLAEAACAIGAAPAGLSLTWSTGERLVGRISPTAAGFRLVGSHVGGDGREQPVTLDFFDQGSGRYSAVLPRPDGTLLDVDVVTAR
jgi:hypothetical protein